MKCVFEALFKQNRAFYCGTVTSGCKNVDDTVSRATVYRCLPLLVESGVIRKIDVGQENKYYALNGRSETFKAQVICSNCDRIQDVDALLWNGMERQFQKN